VILGGLGIREADAGGQREHGKDRTRLHCHSCLLRNDQSGQPAWIIE
jgi:hypothetical protein